MQSSLTMSILNYKFIVSVFVHLWHITNSVEPKKKSKCHQILLGAVNLIVIANSVNFIFF